MIEIVQKYWSIITSILLAMWSVYQYFSGKQQRKAATDKTNIEILVATNTVLRQEILDLRTNKSEILKSNTELIAMNRQLIEKNDEFSTRIRSLETQVKDLKTKLIQAHMLNDEE